QRMGITSASFPPLGCGNGNLEWSDVRPVIERYLINLDIPIYVHSLHVGNEFVPEHKEAVEAPKTLEAFWKDLRATLYEHKGYFETGETGHPFTVKLSDSEIGIV